MLRVFQSHSAAERLARARGFLTGLSGGRGLSLSPVCAPLPTTSSVARLKSIARRSVSIELVSPSLLCRLRGEALRSVGLRR